MTQQQVEQQAPRKLNLTRHNSTSSNGLSASRMVEKLAALNGPRHSVYWVNRKKSVTVEGKASIDASSSTKDGPQEYTIAGKYTGDWKDGRKDGYGVFIYSDGSKYEGSWEQGKKEGRGTFWVEEKKKLRKQYAGEWRRDKRHGMGMFFYEDGSKYEGYWVKNKREGKGRMVYGTDQSVYEGDWAQNERTGFGTLTLSNGDRYEGYWLHDKKEGPGKYFYKASNKVYEGEWADGAPRCGTYHDNDDQDGICRAKGGHDTFELPPLELVDPNEVVSESIALVRQERVLEEAFRCRSHHDQEDSKDQDEDEDVPHGLNGVVFDEATLHLIQKEFNTFQKDKNGSIRCGYLRRILLSLEMYVSDTKIQNLLEEIGATEDTLISFAECVDILSLLAESQLTIEEEEQREVKEKDEEED